MTNDKGRVPAELLELCHDRDLVTPEQHTPNDFYGHAAALKRYAGLPADYRLKAVVEHAPFDPTYAWTVDLAAPLPMLLTFSADRHAMLRERGAHTVHALGPLLHYTEPHLSAGELAQEKARLGRTLLAFPSHSSHLCRLEYDMEAFCQEIDRLAPDFDTVRVCMYWKDVLHGDSEIYAGRGYELVSAGHMFDLGFLARLKSLMLNTDLCMSCAWGTFIGYAMLLNKPMYIHELPYVCHLSGNETLQPHDPIRQQVMDHFREYRMEITPEQRQAVRGHWGLDHLRTPGELRALLDQAEEAWASGVRSIVVETSEAAKETIKETANG